MAHVLQILADVVHFGKAKEDPSKIFLADGGQAFGVGEELYLKHLCLQVVHEPGGARQTADRKRHHQNTHMLKGTLNMVTNKTTKGLSCWRYEND